MFLATPIALKTTSMGCIDAWNSTRFGKTEMLTVHKSLKKVIIIRTSHVTFLNVGDPLATGYTHI